MKKFLLACLGILTTVSFAACGPKVSEKPKSHSPKQSQQIPRKKQSSDINGVKKKEGSTQRGKEQENKQSGDSKEKKSQKVKPKNGSNSQNRKKQII